MRKNLGVSAGALNIDLLGCPWKSWALWLALASLVCFAVMQTAGVDIGAPVAGLMVLLLLVMVAFGVINDPVVRGQLGLDTGLQWYQSKLVWVDIVALIVYCVRLFFNLDVGPLLNGLLDQLLPVMIALGIVESPALDNVQTNGKA